MLEDSFLNSSAINNFRVSRQGAVLGGAIAGPIGATVGAAIGSTIEATSFYFGHKKAQQFVNNNPKMQMKFTNKKDEASSTSPIAKNDNK